MSYSISRVTAQDAESDVRRTWVENFPHLPSERFAWIYRENPAGQAAVWLARKDGEIVGATSLLRRRFSAAGASVEAGIMADFCVAAGHRGFGPALALQREPAKALDAEGLAFVYGLPNEKAAPLLRRAGYVTIGSVVEFTLPLRTEWFLRRKLRWGAAARAVSVLGDLALRLWYGVVSLRRTRRRYDAEDPSSFDGRFDDLWISVRSEHALIGERSSRFLEWRFAGSPQQEHKIFAVTDAMTRELTGYVVYHDTDRRAIVDDILSRDMGEGLDNLLIRFAQHQRRARTDAITITFFGSPHLMEGLKRNGFSVRGSTDPVVVATPPESEIRDLVASPSNWWLCRADNDV